MTPSLPIRWGRAPWGDLPALRRDPLGFLVECAQADARVIPLRLPFVSAFLLLDPADIERVLVADHRDFVKPPWLRTPVVRRLLGDGLVTSDGEPWRRQRRICQPAFHPGRMPGYGIAIAALAERTLDGWHAGETRDISHDMARLTLEVVTQTLLGVDGADQTGPISAAMDTLMHGFSAPYSFFGLLPRPPTLREAGATRRLNRLVDGLIRDGQSAGDGGGPQTLLFRLRAAPDTGGCPAGNRQSHRQVREQVKTFLAAGHESSALALTWAFLLLAVHPEADARLGTELQTVLGDRPPTPDDLPNLPYVQAVVQETLRLYPPLWMTGRRAVRRCEIGGYTIRAGSILLASPWAVQRRPQLFPDPDAFRPERWTDPAMAARPRFSYFPFGGGPRACIGRNFALMETGLLLAAVARRFRLELIPALPVRPWATMTLRPPSDVHMRLIAREFGA